MSLSRVLRWKCFSKKWTPKSSPCTLNWHIWSEFLRVFYSLWKFMKVMILFDLLSHTRFLAISTLIWHMSVPKKAPQPVAGPHSFSMCFPMWCQSDEIGFPHGLAQRRAFWYEQNPVFFRELRLETNRMGHTKPFFTIVLHLAPQGA